MATLASLFSVIRFSKSIPSLPLSNVIRHYKHTENLFSNEHFISTSQRKPSHKKFSPLQAFKQPSSLFTLSDLTRQDSSLFPKFDKIDDDFQIQNETSESESEKTCVYVLQFMTSRESQSSISDPNGAILLAIIGQQGKTLLAKINSSNDIDDVDDDDCKNVAIEKRIRFQQGSLDVIKFKGVDAGEISAIWIAPVTGTWRLDSIRISVSKLLQPSDRNIEDRELSNRVKSSQCLDEVNDSTSFNSSTTSSQESPPFINNQTRLNVATHNNNINNNNNNSNNNNNNNNNNNFTETTNYLFQVFKPEIIGESTAKQAIELRPKSVDKSHASVFSPDSISPGDVSTDSLINLEKLREQSMQEYESLKRYLVLTTTGSVIIGSVSTYSLIGLDFAQAYATGGLFAIFYILYLQLVVDEIPGPKNLGNSKSKLNSVNESWTGSEQVLTKFKKVILLFSPLALFSQVLVLKNEGFSISSTQLLAGVLGFLTHKISLAFGAMNSNYSNLWDKK